MNDLREDKIVKKLGVNLIIFLFAFAAGYILVPKFVMISEKSRSPIAPVVDMPQLNVGAVKELETIDTNELWKRTEESSRKMKMLETGEGFQPDEIAAQNGESFLGLFEENGDYILRSTKVHVKTVKIDMKYEYDGGTGIRNNVSVNGKNEPLFLLKNASKIRAGKVTCLFRGLSFKDALIVAYPDKSQADVMTNFGKGFLQEYEFGGKSYALKVIEARDEQDNPITALFLEGDGKRQLLYAALEANVNLGNLYWVGDLDRDGKLDFYMSLGVNSAGYDSYLLLSSEAGNDTLVKVATGFHLGPGC